MMFVCALVTMVMAALMLALLADHVTTRTKATSHDYLVDVLMFAGFTCALALAADYVTVGLG